MSGCVFCPDNWDNLATVWTGAGLAGQALRVITPLDPVTPGHVLVISENHTDSAAEGAIEAASLMYLAALYVKDRELQANIITSIGPHATQTVRHTHVHVVPRTANDGLPLPWTPQHELKALRAIQTSKQIAQESGFGDPGRSVGLFQQSDRSKWAQPNPISNNFVVGDDLYWPTNLYEGLSYDE